jgi:hypothetical protein
VEDEMEWNAKSIFEVLGRSFTVLGAIASSLIAIWAAKIARTATRTQLNVEKWSANYSFIDKAFDLLSENNELLELHGISTHEIEHDKITTEQFCYILYQFAAGDAYYRVQGDIAVELTPYRKRFIENEICRTVWKKYLDGKFFNTNPFTQAVNRQIGLIEGGHHNPELSAHTSHMVMREYIFSIAGWRLQISRNEANS